MFPKAFLSKQIVSAHGNCFLLLKDSNKIGRGGYSTVYRVDNWKEQGTVAMKRIEINYAGQDLIDRELKILKRLDHPRIVKFHEYEITSEGYLHVFMEYLPMGSLWNIIKQTNKKGLDEESAKHFTKQTLEGLTYLHPKYVHRDLKPDNILITDKYNVKLCDFGFTKILKEETAGKTTEHFTKDLTDKGTWRYMAPEILKPDPDIKPPNKYGPPVDIWSFGWTVIAILTGDIPMPEWDAEAMFLSVSNRQLPPYKLGADCSEKVKDLIQQCLQIPPSDRPSAEQLLSHEFFIEWGYVMQ